MNVEEGDSGDQKARGNENRGGERERGNEELEMIKETDERCCPCSDIRVASACPSIPQLGKTCSSDRGG